MEFYILYSVQTSILQQYRYGEVSISQILISEWLVPGINWYFLWGQMMDHTKA